MRKISKQSGFTISELLVAMGLGLSLIAGAVVVFVQNNRSVTQDEQISSMLVNGRYAVRLLSRELAMAGFWGKYLDIYTLTEHSSVTIGDDCGDGGDWVMDLQSLQFLNNATTSLVGDTFECLPEAQIVPGSDILAVKRVADAPTADGSLASGQIYVRTNIAQAQMFLGGASGTPPTMGGTQSNWAYLPRIFYLRNFSIYSDDGLPALCNAYLDTGSTPDMDNICLVDGIEDIQFEFGVDDDGDFVADYFTSTPSDAALADAVAARIYVLARSVSTIPGYTNDKTYVLGSKTVAPANDGYYRRVFNTTIKLRNPTNLQGIGI